MKFGLGPYLGETDAGRHPAKAYRHMLEQASLARESAFDSIWIGEAHFTEDGLCSAPFVAAAALATQVDALRIGIVATLGLAHPLYIAEDAATLDNISNGRLIIAANRAIAGQELTGWNVPPDACDDRFWESVDILLRSWAPAPFRFQGEHYRVPANLPANVYAAATTQISITPKPAQPCLPLWVAAHDEAAIRQAARRGLPVLGLPFDSFSRLEEKLNLYRKLRGPRRPDDTVPVIRQVYVADDDQQARADAEEPLLALYRAYREWGLFQGELDYATLVPDRCIVGSVDTVIAEMARYRDSLGVNYMICHMALPGLGHEKALAAIELLGKGVISEFRMVNFPREVRLRSLRG